jgi:hypothetical protein
MRARTVNVAELLPEDAVWLSSERIRETRSPAAVARASVAWLAAPSPTTRAVPVAY